MVVSEPAKDVIFLGLDLNVDEEVVSLPRLPPCPCDKIITTA